MLASEQVSCRAGREMTAGSFPYTAWNFHAFDVKHVQMCAWNLLILMCLTNFQGWVQVSVTSVRGGPTEVTDFTLTFIGSS
jgi:hypothetical protein